MVLEGKLIGLAFLLTIQSCLARGEGPAEYDLFSSWNGRESITAYCVRANLSESKTLELGNGVTLDLCLVPAGIYRIGTPEPLPPDELGFATESWIGFAALVISSGILLSMMGFLIFRAWRKRCRPQVSLTRLLILVLVMGVGLLGSMHWRASVRAVEGARVRFRSAMARYDAAFPTEKPSHQVQLTKPFYIGKHEVTQEQYEQVVGRNPSRTKGLLLPVDRVSWHDAHAFCQKVQEITGKSVRLPTNAEWECACRAGSETAFCSGDSLSDLAAVAWYGNYDDPHPVGQKSPNNWGLYDMHGNVQEWVADRYEAYNSRFCVDPVGPAIGEMGVLRGGSVVLGSRFCRSASRFFMPLEDANEHFGFRIVVESDQRPAPPPDSKQGKSSSQ